MLTRTRQARTARSVAPLVALRGWRDRCAPPFGVFSADRDRAEQLTSGQPVAIRQQQHLGQQTRRDRRTTPPLRVALREVLVTHDPIAVPGQQRIDRVLRQQPRAPRRVKESLLTLCT